MAPRMFSITNTTDILSAHLMQLEFTPLPQGADDGGSNWGSQGLLIKHTEVVLPQIALAQVRVPILGWPIAFRGSMVDHSNRFQAAFWEDSEGASIKTLWKWFQLVRRFDDGTGLDKNSYAVTAYVRAYATDGSQAFGFELDKVWPVSVTPPSSGEDTSPVRHQCEFSVDHINPESLTTNNSAANAKYYRSGGSLTDNN